MSDWQTKLRSNPFPVLLSSENNALRYLVRRDLLVEKVESVEHLWRLPAVERIVNKQQENGSWKYPGGKEYIRSAENYNQLETYRILGTLIEKYGLNKGHPAIRKPSSYLFSHQTEEGDFRGIYGNQYTPNYTAAMIELLVKAGYGDDPRIEEGFNWLLSIRQNDGGWAIPLRTIGKEFGTLNDALKRSKPIKPNQSKPFSHCITGVVLRAFAAHERHRNTKEAKVAGELLESRFFQPDKYPDRKASDFWMKFSFPFWFTDLLSALDSLSLLGFSADDEEVNKALEWFVSKQQENGSWRLSLLRTKDKDLSRWIGLAICRVFKRFYGEPAAKS